MNRRFLIAYAGVFSANVWLLGPAQVRAANDDKKDLPEIVGRWQLEYEYMGNAITDEYEIKVDKNDMLSGRITRDGKEISKLEKFRMEGRKITFTAKGTTEGVDWIAEFEAKIEGDEIDGTVKLSANDQSFDLPWKPKRVKQEKK